MPETRHKSLGDSFRPEQLLRLGHDQRTPAHTHTMGHLVYPATGVLSMVTSAGAWIAPPNRMVWIPAGFEHQHRAHGSTDMRIVFIRADMAQLLPEHPAVLVTTALAREAVLALTTDDRERSDEALTRLRLVVIDDVVAAPEQPLHLPAPRDDRLLAATDLVQHNLDRSLPLARIGKRIGTSERTLNRLFSAETGMSYLQWRTQLRIHRALLLLADGKSVTHTAVACGWANPSAFIEIFTLLVGETPGKYRRELGHPE